MRNTGRDNFATHSRPTLGNTCVGKRSENLKSEQFHAPAPVCGKKQAKLPHTTTVPPLLLPPLLLYYYYYHHYYCTQACWSHRRGVLYSSGPQPLRSAALAFLKPPCDIQHLPHGQVLRRFALRNQVRAQVPCFALSLRLPWLLSFLFAFFGFRWLRACCALRLLLLRLLLLQLKLFEAGFKFQGVQSTICLYSCIFFSRI